MADEQHIQMPEEGPLQLLWQAITGQGEFKTPPGKRPTIWPFENMIPPQYSRKAEPRGSIFNAPAFSVDPTATGVMKSVKGLGSKIPKVLKRFPGKKMKAPSFRNFLRKHGISEQEIKASGVDDLIRGKKDVTLDEVKQLGGPQVGEIQRGGAPAYKIRPDAEGGYSAFLEDGTKITESSMDMAVVETNAEKMLGDLYTQGLIPGRTARPKFSEHIQPFPKGENYREVLLTLPPQRSAAQNDLQTFVKSLENKYGHDFIEKATPAEMSRYQELARMKGSGSVADVSEFRSGHWDEPNVFAHLRLDDRVDAAGKRVLMVQEVQSDWAQAVRSGGEGVPELPFSENWHEVSMKRALHEAVEGGYDKLAWTTGGQQAERYDLSKYLDEVSSQRVTHKTFHIKAKQKGGDGVIDKVVLDEDLEKVVGKDLAAKVKKFHEGHSDVGTHSPQGIFKDLDLKVGGEWAEHLYDEMIPNFMKKYVKRLGGKVSTSEVGGTKGHENLVPDSSGGFEIYNIHGQPVGYADDVNQADSMLRKMGLSKEFKTVHSITITPKMRSKIMQEGQTMFEFAPFKVGGRELIPGEEPEEQPKKRGSSKRFVRTINPK